MDTVTTRLDAAAVKAEEASDILHDFANGGVTEEVVTAGGNVPTIAKFVADKSAEIDAQFRIDSEGAGLIGYTAETTYEDGTVGRALNVAKLLHEMNGYTDRGEWVTGTQYWDGEFYTFIDKVYFVDVPHIATTVEADLSSGLTSFRQDIPILPSVPSANRGPVFVIGKGMMEWDGSLGVYVAKSGGATGGGADQIFYLNGQVITESFHIEAGKHATTRGPVSALDGVVVSGADGSVWGVL